jgi:hypothetical protein
VKCDATLMKNVKTASEEILAQHSKINHLIMSPGFLATSGRDETSEGVDKNLAVQYYARWKFIDRLLPALRQAKEAEEESRVFSVLAAGTASGKVDVDGLGLKKGYSVQAAAYSAPTYNDLMIQVRQSLSSLYCFEQCSYRTIRSPTLTVLPRAQPKYHVWALLSRRRGHQHLVVFSNGMDARSRSRCQRFHETFRSRSTRLRRVHVV